MRNDTGEFPTLNKPREMYVLAVGVTNERLPALAHAFVKQQIVHNFIRGVAGKGHEPLDEFIINADTVSDVRAAAEATLERGGLEGLSLSVTGVKRAATRILNETKSPSALADR